MLKFLNKLKNINMLSLLKGLRFKLLRTAIYVLVLVSAVLIGFSVFFPVDRLKDFAEHTIQARTGMKVLIDDVSFYGLTGIRFSGIRLFSTQSLRQESAPQAEQTANGGAPNGEASKQGLPDGKSGAQPVAGGEGGITGSTGDSAAGGGEATGRTSSSEVIPGAADDSPGGDGAVAGSGSGSGSSTGAGTEAGAGAGAGTSTDASAKTVAAAKPKSPAIPKFMFINEISARVRILPLLIGRLNLGFELDGLGGHANGVIRGLTSFESQSIAVKLEGLNMATLILLKEKIGFPLEGTLDADVNMNLNRQDSTKSTGRIQIELKNGKLGQGSIPLPPGMMFSKFDLTSPTSLGNLKLALRLGEQENTDQGDNSAQAQAQGKNAGQGVVASRPRIPVPQGANVLHIEQIDQDSEDLTLQGAGYITLLPDVRFSRPDVNLKFKLKEGFVSRNHLSPIMQARQFRNAERDGFYGVSVQGTITKLNARFTRPQPSPTPNPPPTGAR